MHTRFAFGWSFSASAWANFAALAARSFAILSLKEDMTKSCEMTVLQPCSTADGSRR